MIVGVVAGCWETFHHKNWITPSECHRLDVRMTCSSTETAYSFSARLDTCSDDFQHSNIKTIHSAQTVV